MNTLVVNLYGGPGSGKSTGAAYIFSKLKMSGVNCEYVTEFAKDKTWEGAKEELNCQIYITGKQVWRMTRVFGKVDVIVTDSPIALGSQYTDDEMMKKMCIHEDKKFTNTMNVFVKRVKEYNPSGRNQTEEEAKIIDERIKKMLVDNDMPYETYEGNVAGYDELVENIMKRIKNEKST